DGKRGRAHRRRSPRRADRDQGHARRAAGLRGGRRGRERPGGRGPRRPAQPGRRTHGPQDAGDGRCRGHLPHPQGLSRDPRPGAHHLRLRGGHPAGRRGGGDGLRPQGRAARGALRGHPGGGRGQTPSRAGRGGAPRGAGAVAVRRGSQRPGGGGARSRGAGEGQQGDSAHALDQRGHRKVPPAARRRKTGRRRSRLRRRRRDATRTIAAV
ncbi:MAG: Two-component transcriptional response regulator, LuxR family, partial [uncultured Rubrobacteraceae bacterium]